MERLEIEIDPDRRLIAAFEGEAASARLDLARCVHVKQVHGSAILEAQPGQTGLIGEADGIVARGAWFRSSPHPLAVKTADCIPLLLWDERRECAVALHAGWRGLAQGIHRVPFEKGWCDPQSTRAVVGPSLNGANFEVGEDMWRRFPGHCADERFFRPAASPDKRFFYAWDFVAAELARLGVAEVRNVAVDTLVTPEFASYRRARGELSGARNLSWIGGAAAK